jgi:RNA polymerase sigma-70 factor (ECF subfamily)
MGTPAGFDPEPWRGELLGFVAKMGAGQEAEDVVQETFLRAIRSPPGSRPRAWLHQVALNVLRDRARRLRSEEILDGGDEFALLADRTPDPRLSATARDTVRIAWEIVSKLPERPRAALILRIQRHMEYEEIAVALNCSVGTARQHFHLAVRAVRDALAGERDD